MGSFLADRMASRRKRLQVLGDSLKYWVCVIDHGFSLEHINVHEKSWLKLVIGGTYRVGSSLYAGCELRLTAIVSAVWHSVIIYL